MAETDAKEVLQGPCSEEETTVFESIACGGTGGELAAVDTKNGKIVRIRPLHLDTVYTEEEMADSTWEIKVGDKVLKPDMKARPNWFALAYKNRVYSKNRVKYPLKRVDWEPGGDPEKINAQNRGKSKFVRISWDEAIDIIESEIKRVVTTYGPYSVFTIGEDGHRESKDLHAGGGMHSTLMSKIAGYTRETRTPDSVEGWYWGAKHVWGSGSNKGLGMCAPAQTGYNAWNVVKDVTENAEFITFDAGDWETTQNYSALFLSTVLKFWDELGKEIVVVDPFCNYTAVCHDYKWIPVLPNTDAALHFGLMYEAIVNDLYDKDYVATHTVGFDKLKAYIMGEEDDIVKNAAWAAERCGVPEYTIKAYARKLFGKRSSHAHFSSGSIKGPYSHEPGRTAAYLLGMQGLGKPGVQMLHMNATTIARENIARSTTAPFTSNNKCRMFYPNAQSIPRTMVAEALTTGKAKWWGSPAIVYVETSEQFQEFNYPAPDGGCPVHMLWSEKPCNMNCWDGGFNYQDAIRTPAVECFVTNHQWLENDSLFADLVLPVTTCIEDNDTMGASQMVSRRYAALAPQAIDHIGESLSDYQIACKIGERFGVRDQIDMGMTDDEWHQFGFEQSRLGEEITWEEFQKRGFYMPKLAPDWEQDSPGMTGFYLDPEGWPLDTPSGKLEFYSEALAENFPDDKERQPLAKWLIGGPAEEGWTHDETLWGERCKQFPLLLVANPAKYRVHVQGDDIKWFREIETVKVKGKDGYMYEPAWINPVDAEKRSIQNGDLVKIFNDRGTVLFGARISERIIPGAVMVNKGSRVDPITSHLDRGGAINLISPSNQVSKHCKGFAVTGYLVETAKVTEEEYNGWVRDYPEAFNRDYDPAIGINYASWVIE